MTRLENFNTPEISDKDFVLATDLDGTFLGGSPEDRAEFYGWIENNRHRVGLIFVTGRDPAFITELTREGGVPRPDYVIGDVGTTIASVTSDHEIEPITTLEEPIAQAWDNASAKVMKALDGAQGLKLQPTAFRYRASYDLDPTCFDERIVPLVKEMGLDVLISDNRFLDVLPPGVSKGPSLLRLLAHLDIKQHKTLAAGDTLNDLSMLALGLPAVAVGGSEAALLDHVGPMEHVYVARGIGVAGIAEAVNHHDLFPNKTKER